MEGCVTKWIRPLTSTDTVSEVFRLDSLRVGLELSHNDDMSDTVLDLKDDRARDGYPQVGISSD